VVGLIVWGILERRSPRRHVPIMLVCFALDLVNVSVVEAWGRWGRGKGAVLKGLEAISGEGIGVLDVHVATSVLVALGYVVAAFTGRSLLATGRGRGLHRLNAGGFVLTKAASWLTSFWV
jgi:hypothetical protein